MVPNQAENPSSRAREVLLRRLIDYVAMPASRMAPQDRAMGGDILLDMLFHATNAERQLCARRLRLTREAPRRLMRYLAQCDYEVAQPLLEENESFNASDLIHILEQTGDQHRIAIAARKVVSTVVVDRLIDVGNNNILRTLLENKGADLSEYALDCLVERSRDDTALCAPIIAREETQPAHAMTLFWWSDSDTRRAILQRYAANRLEMIEMCSDVFAMAAKENWADTVSRKTLQLIERRQRDRGAINRSPYDSLEHAVSVASIQGMSPELVEEIGCLAGIKPLTAAKILADGGGESAAVLCKATGLKREYLTELWVALRRPVEDENNNPHPLFEYVHETYDLLTVAKAQTTLRYWNWSLSSAFSAGGRGSSGLSAEDAGHEETFSAARRAARLVLGNQD